MELDNRAKPYVDNNILESLQALTINSDPNNEDTNKIDSLKIHGIFKRKKIVQLYRDPLLEQKDPKPHSTTTNTHQLRLDKSFAKINPNNPRFNLDNTKPSTKPAKINPNNPRFNLDTTEPPTKPTKICHKSTEYSNNESTYVNPAHLKDYLDPSICPNPSRSPNFASREFTREDSNSDTISIDKNILKNIMALTEIEFSQNENLNNETIDLPSLSRDFNFGPKNQVQESRSSNSGNPKHSSNSNIDESKYYKAPNINNSNSKNHEYYFKAIPSPKNFDPEFAPFSNNKDPVDIKSSADPKPSITNQRESSRSVAQSPNSTANFSTSKSDNKVFYFYFYFLISRHRNYLPTPTILSLFYSRSYKPI
ncbi:hypothetical protein AYI70_g9119 [Smittium culicis]|uniref:Uncharacterized protein n=1 Tax=Smittium culicis TaxID=133412 RepID=A0A1R1XCW3_9FUNG|nr:hypothetical protein AYI70_g9119 [Smittium culicis]